MEQYVPEFSARDVDGQELLQMDGNRLKVRTRRTSPMASERAQCRTTRFMYGKLLLSLSEQKSRVRIRKT